MTCNAPKVLLAVNPTARSKSKKRSPMNKIKRACVARVQLRGIISSTNLGKHHHFPHCFRPICLVKHTFSLFFFFYIRVQMEPSDENNFSYSLNSSPCERHWPLRREMNIRGCFASIISDWQANRLGLVQKEIALNSSPPSSHHHLWLLLHFMTRLFFCFFLTCHCKYVSLETISLNCKLKCS